jgi:hypothetical protein
MTNRRIQWLAVAAAALCVAVVGVGFSGASFRAAHSADAKVSTAGVAVQVFTPASRAAGARTAAGSVLIPGDDLRPGGPARETIVDLHNGGDTPALLTLGLSGLPQDGKGLDLLKALELSVESCGVSRTCTSHASLYDGAPASMGDVALPGTVDDGEHRYVRVRLSWPADNDDDALYGAAATFSLDWAATSS